MTSDQKPYTAEQLAQLFHETYERLAPDHGYRTREESAKPWDDVPAGNRRLMIATCAEVLDALAAAGRLLPAEAEREEEWSMRYKLNGKETLGEDGGHVFNSHSEAQRHIEAWTRHYPTLHYSDVRYVRRDAITTPWVEVDPSTEEATAEPRVSLTEAVERIHALGPWEDARDA
jgi:hypothetical protein